MRVALRLAGAVLALCSACESALAVNPGERVENFRLIDHRGGSQELYYLSDMKAVVVMIHATGCPAGARNISALQSIRERYRRRGVEVLLLSADPQERRAAVGAEARAIKHDMPVLLDETQLIGESLGATHATEVFVIETKEWKLRYRGPIDDRFGAPPGKPSATQNYLTDALENILAGRRTAIGRVAASGCPVLMAEHGHRPSHAQISYAKAVAPLLIDKCVACHRSGGSAPWAMSSYEMIKGFAPMIRETIRTKRMPPWHADSHHGTFLGDRSLTAAEARTLVHWIEAGAPRGADPDPLLIPQRAMAQWQLGTPDLLVDVPPFDVPASGVVNYEYSRWKNRIGRDVWVGAVEVHPSDRAVVHHISVFADDPARSGGVQTKWGNILLGGYSPGMEPVTFPAEAAVFLPTEADLVFQVHYTPIGKPVTDRSVVGLHFLSKPPQYVMEMVSLAQFQLAIPPRVKAHVETVETVWDRDILLYSLMPHAHWRGSSARMTAIYPDGRVAVLLNVPKYDFSWQTNYQFAKPLRIPRETKFIWQMTWDNSAQNRANPDPDSLVRWGEQTFDEMGIGSIGFRYLDENSTAWLQKRQASVEANRREQARD
jgi:peroxiredoxin